MARYGPHTATPANVVPIRDGSAACASWIRRLAKPTPLRNRSMASLTVRSSGGSNDQGGPNRSRTASSAMRATRAERSSSPIPSVTARSPAASSIRNASALILRRPAHVAADTSIPRLRVSMACPLRAPAHDHGRNVVLGVVVGGARHEPRRGVGRRGVFEEDAGDLLLVERGREPVRAEQEDVAFVGRDEA